MSSINNEIVPDASNLQPVPLVIGVTAHRDIVDAEVPGIRAHLRAFFEQLRTRFPDLPLVLMCPLAEGGDRLAAREARALGIPLIVPLPFARERYLDSFANDASRAEFDALADGATVAELPPLPGYRLESTSAGSDAQSQHFAQLGVFLSGHCQVLLAIWDGKPSDQLGGTAQVVRYHHEGEMAGYTDGVLDAQQILADSENDLVYHIICSRNRPDGAPADGLKPLETSWYCANPQQPRHDELPIRYLPVFLTMDEFNRDTKSHASHIGRESCGLITPGDEALLSRTLHSIDNLFRVADWLANYFQKRVSASLVATYVLAVLMGLSFIIYQEMPDRHAVLYAFLLLFAGGLCLYGIAQRRGWHRKYLDYRGLAEGLRVQFYWSAAGVTAGERSKFAHDNFLQKQDVELGWIRNVMRYASLEADMHAARDADRGLALAFREWIGNPEGEYGGQIQYYAKQVETRTRKRQLTQAIGMSCLWTGIAIAVVLVLFSDRLEASFRDTLIVFMGVLPLVAAVREAYANKKAEKELIKQYRFMHRIFLNAHRRIRTAASAADKRAILRALGDAALDEHAEWILMHRERPLEHSKL